MKKTACCIALAIAASFSTVAMAHRDNAPRDNAPRCMAELQRANGERVTAYFLASDCKQLHRHAKSGEAVQMSSLKQVRQLAGPGPGSAGLGAAEAPNSHH